MSPKPQRLTPPRPLRLPKQLAFPAFIVATVLVASGCWVCFNASGKNGVDSTPLIWLLILLIAPLLSLVCVIDMWLEERPNWLVGVCALLLLPQAVIWFSTMGVFSYL